ncbi:hypothetical protein T07_4121 [Trichinella nelsoni]|uniref:Uncharacterized protein n=1 Tax=Trichinella nelsoni TaxID=6336 RepID=A0A0V0SJT0_9BILA|nr:hypothetical protein T07_4121 [Trichinella nelsoni]
MNEQRELKRQAGHMTVGASDWSPPREKRRLKRAKDEKADALRQTVPSTTTDVKSSTETQFAKSSCQQASA